LIKMFGSRNQNVFLMSSKIPKNKANNFIKI
jgi:hypothetical protein